MNRRFGFRYFLIACFLLISFISTAQTGRIKGKVVVAGNNDPVEFAVVRAEVSNQKGGEPVGTQTNEKGEYEIENLKPGFYNIKITSVGYRMKTFFEVEVSNSKPAFVNADLESSQDTLQAVVVTANAFQKKDESPVSVRSIGVNEIQRYPGGNRDISRVIQSLPGVGFSTGFRNDLIIRGGSTAENRFYLDDIEIPNINHYSTQGGTGGPVGLINVDFIRDVNFYSSAFPANRGNTLSSALDIRLRDGREDRWGTTLTLGITESAASVEGPLNKKKTATFLGSLRGSYYNWFFKLIQLPIFPNYNDTQFKIKWKITPKDQLTVLGLVACDIFKLNLAANKTEENRFILRSIPVNNQWSYTTGIKYTHFFKESYLQVVLSRNELINKVQKYKDNSRDSILLQDYKSTEAENKLRVEYTGNKKGWKYNVGINYELARYYNYSNFTGEFYKVNYLTKLYVQKYGVFTQVSKSFFKDRLSLSAGLRFDGNSYNKSMANLLNQVSPRLAISYAFTENIRWNFNTGYYHQTPQYTLMGFRDSSNVLVNQSRLSYSRNVHVVTGFEYSTKINSRISIEGFYKQYYNLPFLLNEQISISNQGSDFGVVGNTPAVSNSKGKSYGMELLYEQKLYKGWFGIVSYTLFWSEFQDRNGKYAPSSWDTRHIFSLTTGKKFKRGWEIGARFRLQGGRPYTPYDTLKSQLIPNYYLNPSGILDYSQLNSGRLRVFHQLDIRVTKKWYLKKFSVELYLDIQNVYNNKVQQPDNLLFVTDNQNLPLVNPNDPSRYQTKLQKNESALILPGIGLIFTY